MAGIDLSLFAAVSSRLAMTTETWRFQGLDLRSAAKHGNALDLGTPTPIVKTPVIYDLFDCRKPGKRRGFISASLASMLLGAMPAICTAAIPNPTVEFDRIDSNEDRRVSSSEYEVYTRAQFDAIDSNADDKLTSAEIMASEAKFNRYVFTTGAILGPAQLSTAERVQRIDVNRDGLVSQGEHANAAAAKFQDMDTNDNGELSLLELDPGW